jgi:hypothetical protein
MTKNKYSLQKLEQRCAFLQVRIDEGVASEEDIRLYKHQTAKIRYYEKQRKHGIQSRRIRYQHIRKYNDGIAWHGGYGK